MPCEKASGQPAHAEAPTAPVQALRLARYAPQKDLAYFLEFAGLEAHPAAWRATSAHTLLLDTKLGALLEDLGVQAVDLIQEAAPRGRRVRGSDVLAFARILANNGFLIAAWGRGPGALRPLVVLHRGDRPEVRQLIEDLTASRPDASSSDSKENTHAPVSLRKGGRTLRALDDSWVVWSENGDLILAPKEKADEVVSVIDGKLPSALDHPIRSALAKAEADFPAIAVGFVEFPVLKQLAPEIASSALTGLERIELRCGLQGKAIVTTLRAVAPVPRRGLLALFDQPIFTTDTMPALPSGLTNLAVLSLDPLKSYDRFLDVVKQTDPLEAARLETLPVPAGEEINLRRDLLAHLGPSLALYVQHLGTDGDSPAAMIAARCAGFTVSIQVRNQAAVARALDPLVTALNRHFRGQRVAMRQNVAGTLTPLIAQLVFRRQPGTQTTFVCTLPRNMLPQPFTEAIEPTIMLGPDKLIISGSRAAAERALAAAPRWQPDADLAPLLHRLPAEMVYLRIGDPCDLTRLLTQALPVLVRQANQEMSTARARAGQAPKDVYLRLEPDQVPPFDELNLLLFPSITTLSVDPQGATLAHREAIPGPSSPLVSAGAIALLWPSVQNSREAARRSQCINNLRQMALALHNYHSAHNAFPRPALSDDSEKPLLSWRVAILPYLGYQELYNKFELSEPWNSPHNAALLKEMPRVYLCQNRTKVEPFTTTYRVITGRGALFENDKDFTVAAVTDGTSNTLMVVESAAAVPWTKPDELTFDPAAPASFCGAGSPHPGGFNAAFADAAVRFIPNTIDLKTFRHLVTRNAGEVVDLSQLR
jgi:hypothetical protein